MASMLNERSPAHCFVTGMNLRSTGFPASIPAQVNGQGKRKWDMRGMLDSAHSLGWGGEGWSNPLSNPEASQGKPNSAHATKHNKGYKGASKAKSTASAQLKPVLTPTIPDVEVPIQDAVMADNAPFQESSLNETLQGHSVQHADQPHQGMQTTAGDSRHVMQDAEAEDGSMQLQGAQADIQAHSSGHMATDDSLHGGDAPMQTPLIILFIWLN